MDASNVISVLAVASVLVVIAAYFIGYVVGRRNGEDRVHNYYEGNKEWV